MLALAAVGGHYHPRVPEGAQSLLGKAWAVPRALPVVLALLELEVLGHQGTTSFDFVKHGLDRGGVVVEDSPKVAAMPLVVDAPDRPPLERDEGGLLVPAVVDQPVFVGGLLPVADIVAGDAGLEDEIVITAHRRYRVELDAPKSLEDVWDGWAVREMVPHHRPPGIGLGDLQRRRHGTFYLGGSIRRKPRIIGRMLLLPFLLAMTTKSEARPDKITVASYYFANYHPGDPRNEKNKGPGWSEWELVRNAKPRFPGHHQPNVPLWGYTDESDPKVMAQKIDAAANNGVDAFIFDWYYYDDGPFLDRPIDRGFLKARNNKRLKFAFMWANHDWLEIHPYHRGTPQKLLYPGKVTPETFEMVGDHLVKDYFHRPNYWKIDGKPYFSFYELTKLLDNFGSVAATRAALDRLRAKAVAAGLPGLHLNAVVWGQPILPGEGKPADTAKLIKDLGFDSVTSYVWIHHVGLPQQQTDYNTVRDAYFNYWTTAERQFDVPYFPNVTMGWDSSPRAAQDDKFENVGYPFMNTISGNTPERFRDALEMTKQRLLAKKDGPRVLTINCWNEWTEGSYLEPDVVNGMKYLEAIKAVFGGKGR